jgi:hypothetical protein
MTNYCSVIPGNGLQGSDLIQDVLPDLLRAALHAAPAEADQVGQSRMGSNPCPLSHSKFHGPMHDQRISGMETAGDVGRSDMAHDLFIQTQGIPAETLAHVAIQIY